MRAIAGVLLAASCAALALLYLTPSPKSPSGAQLPAKSPPPATEGSARPSASMSHLAEEPRPTLEALPENIRDVTPAHVLPAPTIEEKMIVRLPATAPPAPPPRPTIWPRAQVLSAGILKSHGTEIVIAGIDPLRREALCADGKGGDWPCGNFARAALQRLVRQRRIECDPTENSEGEEGSQRIVTRCMIAGRDIGEWLVARGWATPLPESGYEAALAAARADRLGQWREGRGRKTD